MGGVGGGTPPVPTAFTTQSLLLRTSLPKPESAENSQVSQAEEHTRASGLGSRATKQYLAGGCFPSPEESAHTSLSDAAPPLAPSKAAAKLTTEAFPVALTRQAHGFGSHTTSAASHHGAF